MYKSDKWRKKVANMSDAQIFAIWKRQQDQPPKPKPKDTNPELPF